MNDIGFVYTVPDSDAKTPIRTFQERYFQRNYYNGEMLFRSASESCTFRIG
jgi:hypothetical protein